MIKHDKEMWWRPGRIYIPANHFTGLSVGAVNEGGATNNAYGALWAGANTGAPISKEISTFGMTSVLMEADGDVVDTFLMLPYDLDRTQNIKARVWWTSGSSTTADTIDWKVFYKEIVADTTTLAAASTALDTVIAQDTVIGAYTVQTTAYGIIKGGTISAKTEAVSIQVEMDTFAVGLSEDKFFLGLELLYTPRRLQGPDGMLKPAKAGAYMLSQHVNG